MAKKSLDALEDQGVGGRPLIFVAHSLGGLVVKKMARLSCERSVAPEPSRRCMNGNLRGVVFLATPHSGSNIGNLAHAARILYRPSVTIDYLRKNNATIDDLGEWFQRYADRDRELHVHAHRETKKLVRLMFLRILVVEPSSANPGIPPISNGTRKLFDTAERDHITICKCKSKGEEVFRKTFELVLSIAPKPVDPPGPPTR